MKFSLRSLFGNFHRPAASARTPPLVLLGETSARSLTFLSALTIGFVLTASATVRAQAVTIHGASESAATNPTTHLAPGTDGNFYGTTKTGGTYGEGTFFRVTQAGVTTVLYNFTGGDDGGAPGDPLIASSDGSFFGTTSLGGSHGSGTAFQATTAGVLSTLFNLGGGTSTIAGFVRGSDDHLYGTSDSGEAATIFKLLSHPAYFDGQTALNNGVCFLAFPDGRYFGYYAFLTDANYIYHFDLGYEYIFDARDSKAGVYLYDFKSGGFFYTSPSFPFPYLYDFSLNTILYYYPDPSNPGRYNTNGYRFFYRFDNGQIIVK